MKDLNLFGFFIVLNLFFVIISCDRIEELAIDQNQEASQNAGNPVGVDSVATAEIIQMEQDVLKYVNEHRASNGKEALSLNCFICNVARYHSGSMAKGTVPFGHTGVNDRASLIWKNVGTGIVGENVALNGTGPKQAFEQWKSSKSHNNSMLGDFNFTGIGIVQKDNAYYFTQIFLKK